MELLKFHGIPWNFYSRCGDSMEFHGIWCWHQVPWNFQSSMEFHGIVKYWYNKFHNWGSVFHCLLHNFMSLYIRQSISSCNIEIFQFQSNFLVPLILVKWWYFILNGGLLYIYIYIYTYLYLQNVSIMVMKKNIEKNFISYAIEYRFSDYLRTFFPTFQWNITWFHVIGILKNTDFFHLNFLNERNLSFETAGVSYEKHKTQDPFCSLWPILQKMD